MKSNPEHRDVTRKRNRGY